jgi:hypothetical protein
MKNRRFRRAMIVGLPGHGKAKKGPGDNPRKHTKHAQRDLITQGVWGLIEIAWPL